MAASRVLMGVNILAALASGIFGAVALAAPSSLVGHTVSPNPDTRFYVDMYAVRSIVIAASLVTASLTLRRIPVVGAIALAGGGLVQVGDAAIAAQFGTPGVVGASVAAFIHLGTAGLMLSRGGSALSPRRTA
ncbi:hypothetical protein [Subtercola boreus]|uniref:hypothetical protein n=1 Tax=Subtercola boreus TaxID=120213 RepID=UPI0011C022CF|nr:hypothetical protein [Subtercola boreus]